MRKFTMSWVQSDNAITASLLIVHGKGSWDIEKQAGLQSFHSFDEARIWANKEALTHGFDKILIIPDSPN